MNGSNLFTMSGNTTDVNGSLFAHNNVTSQTHAPPCPPCSYGEVLDNLRFYIVIAEFIIGVIGNLTSFYVIHFSFLNPENKLCLKCLAVADILFLLCGFLGLFQEDIPDTYQNECVLYKIPGTYQNACVLYKMIISYYLSDVSQFISTWLIVLVASIRYFVVSRYFRIRFRAFVSYRKVVITIMIMVFVANALEISRIMLMFTIGFDTNITFEMKSINHYFIGQGVYFGFVLFIIPFIILLIFSVGLVFELYRRRCYPLKIPEPDNISKGITKMVVTVVLVFCISYTPYLAHVHYFLDESKYTEIRCNRCKSDILFNVSYSTAYFNSCVNFFIYLACIKSFREFYKKGWRTLKKSVIGSSSSLRDETRESLSMIQMGNGNGNNADALEGRNVEVEVEVV